MPDVVGSDLDAGAFAAGLASRHSRVVLPQNTPDGPRPLCESGRRLPH